MGRRVRDERPPVELWGAELDTADELQRVEVGGRSSRRTPLVALAAAAALVVAGLAFGGGGDDPGRSPQQERDNRARDDLQPPDLGATSTSRPRTTTTLPTTTTQVLGPVFDAPVGGALLIGDSGSTWTWLELASGLRRDVEVHADDPWSSVAVTGGVVVLRGGGAHLIPLPEGASVSLGSADLALRSDRPDAVWLVTGASFEAEGGGTLEARLVDLGGATLARVSSAQFFYPLAATSDGLVFTAQGRTFLATPRGTHLLSDDQLLAVAGDRVVGVACDDEARCELRLTDTATGAAVALEEVPNPDRFGSSVEISPAGAVAVLRYDVGPRLTLFDPQGRLLGSVDLIDAQGPPRWLPGDLGVVMAGQSGVVRVSPGVEGQLRVESVAALDDQRGDLVFVIPS